jgi:hypothetical protein
VTALGLALALGVAVVTPAAGPPSAAAVPWVVVQRDGARVAFERAPELRDGRWVGRLRGAGTLVSIPAARVDAEATARANAPGAEPAAPAPRVVPTPRPFETPALGDRAKLKTSGEEASRALERVRKGRLEPVPSPTGAAAGAEAPAESAPTDRHGRDEVYWRERAGVVRGEFEEAGQRLAVAEASLEAAERDFLGTSEAERNTFVLRIQEQRALVEEARQRYQRASAAWEALQEEARKAGAFPGWLR